MNFQVAYNGTTRIARVQAVGTAIPGGSVNVGQFAHPDLTYPDSVVIFHGVRDLLYKRSAANAANPAMFPDNITDMHNVSIIMEYVFLVSMNVTPKAVMLEVDETQQINVARNPLGATNTAVTYVSSTPAVATVSVGGLVTAVAEGTTTITVTGADGNVETVAVTVEA